MVLTEKLSASPEKLRSPLVVVMEKPPLIVPEKPTEPLVVATDMPPSISTPSEAKTSPLVVATEKPPSMVSAGRYTSPDTVAAERETHFAGTSTVSV